MTKLKKAIIQIEVNCDITNQSGVYDEGLSTIIGPHIKSLDDLAKLLKNNSKEVVDVRADWKENLRKLNPQVVVKYIEENGGYDQLKATVNASDLINKRSMERVSSE